jgi:hypothetical protein
MEKTDYCDMCGERKLTTLCVLKTQIYLRNGQCELHSEGYLCAACVEDNIYKMNTLSTIITKQNHDNYEACCGKSEA